MILILAVIIAFICIVILFNNDKQKYMPDFLRYNQQINQNQPKYVLHNSPKYREMRRQQLEQSSG
jgi:hypothetical protein